MSEAALLSVYFEEVAQRQAELDAEARKGSSGSPEPGYETVFEVGMDEGFDEDEDDG